MKYFLTLLFLVIFSVLQAQVAKTQVVQINVETGADHLELKWPLETGHTGNYLVYRRTALGEDWGDPIATLQGSESGYIDRDVKAGTGYEYFVIKSQGTSAIAYGYVYSGIKTILNPIRGGLIMLIDSSYIDTLKDELEQYESDVTSEGYTVYRLYAGRNERAMKVKKRIVQLYEDQDGDISTLFIIGHVPVPYAGDFTGNAIPPPDGHVEGSGNHTGAWPADVFYGDMDGQWFDVSVNNTSGQSDRNHNTPGDGKLDETKLPSDAELQVGRVDMTDIPAYTMFNDIELTRNYLVRNHKWRTDQWRAVERGIIDNNFNGLNLASTGYHNLSAMFPIDSVHDNIDLITSARKQSYMWTYGCGAGSYKSCNGIGVTADWVDTPHTVFTILAGSYFGDWDTRGNFLRAPLGSEALASAWGGIPKWYLHHMALGESIGYGTRITQNNVDEYFNGAFNFSHNSIHIALMGDPTLRMRNLPALSKVTAKSSNKVVDISWNGATGDFEGYLVYRIDTSGDYELLTPAPIKDTSFTDDQNFYSGTYTYAVHTSRLEVTPSGSYYNIGGGDRATVDHVNTTGWNAVNAGMSIYPNPARSQLTVQVEDLPGSLAHIQVKAMDGKVVTTVNTTVVSRQLKTTLDVSEIPNGVYLITVSTTKGTVTERFVVE